MAWRGRRYRARRCLQFDQLIGHIPQPSVPEPQQEETSAESQDHTPGQKREEDQGAAKIQVPDLEADLQELSQSKTGDECGDCFDVQGQSVPKS
ncbi:X antigen family member 5-like [Saimiri boliviensis]|uniref:X antigen family member 5-like n=1 Tax=Saimiri boliviensis TaxID=27679 RepID=UPI00027FC4C8|nr:X antigen family member 5-like [Saimiri boliviensis boliviensis]